MDCSWAPKACLTPHKWLTTYSATDDDDDDDDLPTVAKAFGIPTLLGPADTTTTTTSDFVPRFSVRATTFDGKTMYLKRRPKISHVHRNVSLSDFEMHSFHLPQKVPLTGFTERMGNLLDVPIHRLLEGLSVETASKLQEALVRLEYSIFPLTPFFAAIASRWHPLAILNNPSKIPFGSTGTDRANLPT